MAAEMMFAPSVFCQSPASVDSGRAAPPKANKPDGGVSMIWMILSGTVRIPASRAAHRTAIVENADPSTATTIPHALSDWTLFAFPVVVSCMSLSQLTLRTRLVSDNES
jgi:hypothetical protein